MRKTVGNRRLRIGIDASRAFVDRPTGTERYAYEVITRILQLPEAGEREWVIYVKPNSKFEIGNLKSIFKSSNIKIQSIKLKYLWTQVGLAYRTWVDRLDVLWVPAHTLPVLRHPATKTVVTIHGLEYEWLPAYENLLQRWYLPLSTVYACKTAQRIIAVSEFTKKQITERIGVNEKKIKVVYEGFTKGEVKSKNQASIFNKIDIKPKKYILFVGTIQPRKNLVRLINAFSRLKVRDFELKLVIAGQWGWMYDEVKEAPEKLGVQDKVVFTGYINDTDRNTLLQNALLYVQASITEGFGLPVLEAMAAGVPVVSSSGGALKELLCGGERGKELCTAGLLFDPMDVNDMVDKISQVISNPKLQMEMKRLGKMRADRFDWQLSAIQTYNVLSEITQ